MPYAPSRDGEVELIAALRANPLDDELRAVYADWLEARGDLKRAQFLRTETAAVQPGAELEARVDLLAPPQEHPWRVVVSRGRIERCSALARGEACAGRWDLLPAGTHETRRKCTVCERGVEYCISDKAAKRAGQLRGPIVLDAALDRTKALAAYDGPIRWDPHGIDDDMVLDD